MATANERLFDATIRHQVGIRRFASGEVRRILVLLEAADRDLVRQLRERLIRLGNVRDFTSRRMILLRRDMAALRRAAMTQLRQQLRPSLFELARMEAQFEAQLIRTAMPIQLDLAAVNPDVLRAVVTQRPFQGRLLGGWFQNLAQADRGNLESAFQLGMAQGESVQSIMQRVAGTRAQGFSDGALAMTRRQAEAVVRTGVNHVSNAAREAMWDANADIIQFKRWMATLDGRTTAICRRNDGRLDGKGRLPEGMIWLEPPGARPPAHVSCLIGSCLVTPCDGISAATKRPYQGEVIVVRTLAGHELTCTPNHPILTRNGWQSAQALQEGDRVVRYLGSKDPFSCVDDEVHEGPSPIEEVARPLIEGGQVKSIATSARDFHGDGAEGEVCVVGANRSLKTVERYSPLAQHALEQGLETGSRVHPPLLARGSSTALLEGRLPADRGLVGGGNLSSALFGSSLIPYLLGRDAAGRSFDRVIPRGDAGVSTVPDLDVSLLEDAVENDPGELAISTQVVDALAGEVTLDEIVYVGRRDFSGHVFNLQTRSGIYFATRGSIVTHNCRSVMVAVLDGDEIVGTRPFVRTTETRRGREINFRRMAREQGRSIKDVRSEWTEKNIGQVPRETTYNEWLKRQPAGFQDEVLGKDKGRLFRKGGLDDLGKFVDKSGKEFTLDQLRLDQPEAFAAAGL